MCAGSWVWQVGVVWVMHAETVQWRDIFTQFCVNGAFLGKWVSMIQIYFLRLFTATLQWHHPLDIRSRGGNIPSASQITTMQDAPQDGNRLWSLECFCGFLPACAALQALIAAHNISKASLLAQAAVHIAWYFLSHACVNGVPDIFGVLSMMLLMEHSGHEHLWYKDTTHLAWALLSELYTPCKHWRSPWK